MTEQFPEVTRGLTFKQKLKAFIGGVARIGEGMAAIGEGMSHIMMPPPTAPRQERLGVDAERLKQMREGIEVIEAEERAAQENAKEFGKGE